MPTRIAFQLHQKGVVGGRIFEERGSVGEVGEVPRLHAIPQRIHEFLQIGETAQRGVLQALLRATTDTANMAHTTKQ